MAISPARGGTALTQDTTGFRRVGLVRPTANPAEVLEAHKAIADMVARSLEAGVDYGEIPGTDGKKALHKPGAERLAFGIGASMELEIIEREIDHSVQLEWSKKQKEWYFEKGKRRFKWVESSGTSRGLYRYVVRCKLVRREDGALLGEGIGSCSSLESKYIDRPRDSENTILKMAKKRASVDAVLSALALSGRFAPDDAPPDDDAGDGVVPDPTDGLTLTEALGMTVNKRSLGDTPLKGLRAIAEWAEGELANKDPEDPRMLRLSAAVRLVIEKREAEAAAGTPATPPASAPATPAAASATPAPFLERETDDDQLPF